MEIGIYETLITNSIKQKLDELQKENIEIIQGKKLNPEEAVYYISLHLIKVIKKALNLISAKKNLLVSKQIEISNNLLEFLSDHIEEYSFDEDIIDINKVENINAQLYCTYFSN